MVEQDPTRIGWVRHVLGSTVTVALDSDLAGVAPIYRGQLQPVGQIGSLVRIPQGLIDLIASVSLVGIAELAGPVQPSGNIQHDERWLQVELFGEIDRGSGKFQRGVGTYPGIDDPVHFTTADQLSAVFPPPDQEHLRLGRLAASSDVPVSLEAARLVVRHSAVVGSTGAGKTSAVSSLLQGFVRDGWRGSNIVVIDPHGEYESALANDASIRSVLADGDEKLRVPYWALSAQDISRVFAGSVGGGAFSDRFAALVAEQRRKFVDEADWIQLESAAVTADTPVPFDIRSVWYQMDWENGETRDEKGDPDSACETEPGSAEDLVPAQFKPYKPGGQAPHQGPLYGSYGRMPDLLRLGLLDPRLSFFQEPQGAGDGDPLVGVVQDWLGGEKPVSVLDFSGVPSSAADLAIGVVLDLLFEVAVRTNYGEPGIGRPSPVLVVLEEAHRYLGTSANALTRDATNRIAREGRKYGVGLMLVTQRPTELPKTALAQVGTVIALRLTNAEDQSAIRSALPDSVSGLAAILPSLRTGEAIVSGESVIVPSRTLIDIPDPQPSAQDPSLDRWREAPALADVAHALASWRTTYHGG